MTHVLAALWDVRTASRDELAIGLTKHGPDEADPTNRSTPPWAMPQERARTADNLFDKREQLQGIGMEHAHVSHALGCSLAVALVCAMADARAGGTDNTLKVGYAHIGFNTKSGDLSGPAGTTPPGVQAHLKDARTLGLVYERSLRGPWSVALQVGTPPVIKMAGAGNGAALGQVGTTRAWFPALLAQYTFDGPWGSRPYAGAGVNYTSYTDEEVSPAYTAAFGGSSSTAKLKNSWGPVFKLGVEFPFSPHWVVDVAYSRYGISTTATITTPTPGMGAIVRTVDVESDPDVVSLTLGYRF